MVAAFNPVQGVTTIVLSVIFYGLLPQWYQLFGGVVISAGLFEILRTEHESRNVSQKAHVVVSQEKLNLKIDVDDDGL